MKSTKSNISLEDMKKKLFAGVFIQENMLHTIIDRYSEISCKQWLLMAVASNIDVTPDLSTLAKIMGCSRQNVKKLAIILEKDGYVTLEKSSEDTRSLCVSITKKGNEFRDKMDLLASEVHKELFADFSDEEIEQYYQFSNKLLYGIAKVESYFQKEEVEKKTEVPKNER